MAERAPAGMKFPCTLCDRSYTWDTDLNRHVQKVHKAQVAVSARIAPMVHVGAPSMTVEAMPGAAKIMKTHDALVEARAAIEKLPPDARMAAVGWLEMVFLIQAMKAAG